MALSIENVTSKAFTGGPTSTFSMSTSGTNRLLLFGSYIEGGAAPNAVISSITGGGVTWAKRSGLTWTDSGSVCQDIELWWAWAASQLTAQTITITLSKAIDDAACLCWAVNGVPLANAAAPFDHNGTLPASTFYTGANTQANISGLSTNGSDDMVFAMIGNRFGTAYSTPATGHTEIGGTANGGGSLFSNINAEYLQLSGSALSNATFNVSNQSTTNWAILADAIMASVPQNTKRSFAVSV